MRGEQEATTTRFKSWSSMLFLISSWPGSEHMNLYSLATTTSSSFAAKATTSLDIHFAGDVRPAVADENADPGLSVLAHLAPPFPSLSQNGLRGMIDREKPKAFFSIAQGQARGPG